LSFYRTRCASTFNRPVSIGVSIFQRPHCRQLKHIRVRRKKRGKNKWNVSNDKLTLRQMSASYKFTIATRSRLGGFDCICCDPWHQHQWTKLEDILLRRVHEGRWLHQFWLCCCVLYILYRRQNLKERTFWSSSTSLLKTSHSFVSQLLMEEVVNDENEDLLFLIRVSSTIDYGRTLEVGYSR
jgi:hypothetical protein